TWDSTTVADGNVTLTAYAYDAAGNASSKSVSVVVSNASATPDTVAPVATISNPTSGSAVSGTVSVQASASDNVNVVAIRLYVDGKLTSSASTSSLSYSWNTRKLAAGSHTLVVEADDAAGNKGSQTVQVVR
ncbi:MAG: peptidase S8, partial [Proteobacteria bacterium]|nr:peptidase S8 [Pseudomonadota bacterium]